MAARRAAGVGLNALARAARAPAGGRVAATVMVARQMPITTHLPKMATGVWVGQRQFHSSLGLRKDGGRKMTPEEEKSPRSRLFYALQKVLAGPEGEDLPENSFLVLHEILDGLEQPNPQHTHTDMLSKEQIFALATALISMQEEAHVVALAGKIAAQLFKKGAEKGDLNSEYSYAMLLRNGGHGIPKDTAKAVELLNSLARQGHPYAQYGLGVMYLRGEASEADPSQNYKKAFSLLSVAAQNGLGAAYNMLGNMHGEGKGAELSWTKAVECFEKGAKAGDPSAHMSLAQCYALGNGVAKSEQKAFEHHMAAAKAGLPPALYNVGHHFYSGEGVTQDFKLAALYYEKAARRGFPYAQVNLGSMYREGKGVPRSLERAVAWYKLAAPHDEEAKVLLTETETQLKKERAEQGSTGSTND
eukprot:comp19052_c0_seq1/m.21493 comp19052_c0_seq1/g.21493  ORF comp19052_c0_seq1/g.21493 comp19052_c0_seq1/m.21493 type:complete len:417 (-) comp19052_c0_seq1:992-2242(-)